MLDTRDDLINLKKEARYILGLIVRRSSLSKNEILNITGMKLSTLNRIMEPLEKSELAVEASVGESTGGRRPVLYSANPEKYYLTGVDISRVAARAVIINLKMDILGEMKISMRESETPEKVTGAVADFISASVRKLEITKDKIIGIGVGTLGPMDRKRGIVLKPGGFAAKGWQNVPLKSMLEAASGIPVTMDSGLNAAALAEYIYGAGKGCDNMAYISCGMGIRLGTIASGRVVRTLDEAEDAFGHMIVDMDGDMCGCGNYGCVESYASIPAIMKKVRAEIKKGRTTQLGPVPEAIDHTAVCRAAENGDALAKEVLENAGTILGIGLANLINLMGPRVLILDGPLIQQSGLFFEAARSAALKKCRPASGNSVIFRRGGRFMDNTIAVGAAVAVLEDILPRK